MSTTYLKNLESIGFPKLIELDRDSMVDEIVARIKADPRWTDSFDGEILQSANYAQINYFSYLWSKAAEATNESIRERFITESRSLTSLYNYIQNFGINAIQIKGSEVIVSATVDGNPLTRTLTIDRFTKISGNYNNGTSGEFEFITKDINGKFDYKSDIIVPPGVSSFTTPVFAGKTNKLSVTLNPPEDSEKFRIKLNSSEIQEDSIRIYAFFQDPVKETECIETTSFVVTPVTSTQYPKGIPHYVIKYLPNGDAELIFNTETFGGSFSRVTPTDITIFWRTGGGEASNISAYGINDSIQFTSNNVNVDISFVNTSAGYGGADAENENDLKFFAPYRVGRGKNIVDDTDAIITLASYAEKHIVDSPKYSEFSDKIQLLHYHNYIVPKRNFSSFVFPAVEISDNSTSYSTKFLSALNKFLNLKKIHDKAIEDELMTNFTNIDTSYLLSLTPAMNGTVSLSAFNHAGNEIDRLVYSSNYSGDTLPDVKTNKATYTADNPITTPISIGSGNNKMRFIIDDGPSAPNVEFEITIPTALYGLDANGKATDLAAVISAAITSAYVYYNIGGHAYAFIDSNKKLNIQSAITGEYSFVKVIDTISSAYSFLGIDVLNLPSTNRAKPESGLVFLPTTTFTGLENKVNIKINTSRFDYDYVHTPSPILSWPDANQPTGPTLSMIAYEEDGSTLAKFQTDQTLLVRAINPSDIILDEITFGTITKTNINAGIINIAGNGTGNVFNDAGTINFDYTTGTFVLQLKDSDDIVAPYGFPVAYDNSTRFEIIGKQETYKFTTVSYQPNPYYQEDEAGAIFDLLRAAGKKMMCIEPILKEVEFIPIPLVIKITPKAGKTKAEAYNSTMALLNSSVGYSNVANDNTIGTGFKTTWLSSLLNDNVTSNPTVKSAQILNHTADITDSIGNKYYFILSEEFLLKMQEIEDDNVNIDGFVSLYNVEITS